MDFKEILATARHKSTINSIVDQVGHSAEQYSILVNDFFTTEGYVHDRIIWAISSCLDNAPELAAAHYERFAKLLSSENSSWVKRGITRMMANVPLPKDDNVLGETYAKCFKIAADPKNEIAARAFSIKTCEKIAIAFPALKEELIPLLEDIYKMTDKGVKSSARKALKNLKK